MGKRQVVAQGKWREKTRLQSKPNVPLSGSTGADFGAHVGPPPPRHPSQFPRHCSQTRPGPNVVNFAEQGSARSEKVQMRNERGLGAMTGEGMVSGGEWVSEVFRKQGKNKKDARGVFERHKWGKNHISHSSDMPKLQHPLKRRLERLSSVLSPCARGEP
ncbi:hypothetical protein PO909_033410 [Leuciscus waleckii]